MKAKIHEESPKSNLENTWKKAWEDTSASTIMCYLEDLRKFLDSLGKSLDGPYTFASKELVEIIKSRPDYPELERKMKKVYGPGWELVPYEEADKKLIQEADPIVVQDK